MRLENKARFLWAATAVLLVAAAMRIIMLQDVPPGLARDEVRNGDIVHFIRQGEHALFFRAGFGHEPLYHYFSVPFQALLGDNVLSIRLPSVVLGILLVAMTMRWIKRDFGGLTAVITGFGLSVGWISVIFSRIGVRAIMEPLLLVAAAWFWQKRPILAGLFLGLSLYTYTAARVVFALPILFALVQMVIWKLEPETTRKSLRAYVQPSLIILFVTIMMYLPLQITLWADPTLQMRVQQFQGPLLSLLDGDLRPVWESAVATLGIFSFSGSEEWTYTVPGLPLFNWITAVFFYAGLFIALWRIRQSHYTFVLIWLLVGISPSAITSPSIIRIIGAIPVIYLLPALFVSSINGDRPKKKWQHISMLFLIMLYGLSLTGYTVINGFIIWPSKEETHHKYQTILQDMGRHWNKSSVDVMVIMQNFYEPIEVDTMRRNTGSDIGARWVQARPDAAGAMVIPNNTDGYLYVPEYAAPRPELLAAAGVVEQPLYRSEKRPSFAVYPLPPINIPIPIAPLSFDEKIKLLGYEIGTHSTTELELFTYWQVEAPLPPDLTIFIHLLDDDGNLLAQHDGLDVAPSTIHPHDHIIQRHTLPLPIDITVDSFPVYIGMYTQSTNTRLSIDGSNDTVIHIFNIE